MIKKISHILLVMALVIPLFIPGITRAANDNRTIRDLKNEIDALEKKLDSVENDKNLTNQQIAEIKINLESIGKEMISIDEEIVQIGIDIEKLNEDIEKKDEQIKELVNFLQVTNGESMYLEYAFGAQTMTDFIYRVSIVEQMTNYNQQLIDEMHKTIKEKNQKTKDLDNKKEYLDKKKIDLANEQAKLGNRIGDILEEEGDMKKQIADARKTLDNYLAMGCTLDQKISQCARIPLDVDFARPLQKGCVSGNYGYQASSPLNPSSSRFHNGIDLACNPWGTPVYATASGLVVGVGFASCGGNYVIIQHKINGEYYASRYLHLHSVSVKEKDVVTKDTIIGTVGGGESYDSCSTGPHLHFVLAKGLYGRDFSLFIEPHIFNPGTKILVPNVRGAAWNNRYQKIY